MLRIFSCKEILQKGYNLVSISLENHGKKLWSNLHENALYEILQDSVLTNLASCWTSKCYIAIHCVWMKSRAHCAINYAQYACHSVTCLLCHEYNYINTFRYSQWLWECLMLSSHRFKLTLRSLDKMHNQIILSLYSFAALYKKRMLLVGQCCT